MDTVHAVRQVGSRNMESRIRGTRQLERLAREGKASRLHRKSRQGSNRNLTPNHRAAFVIYGEPQSGKTEMMICLTARLLDEGVFHSTANDVDLLGQNLGRFQSLAWLRRQGLSLTS